MPITIPMPIGIPVPALDFMLDIPAHPVDWSSEVAGYYYIDMELGSDSNTWGTPANPRRSLPYTSALPPGTLVVMRGSYLVTIGSKISLWAMGTLAPWVANTSGPVFFDGGINSDRPCVIDINQSLLLIHGENIYVDGFTTANDMRTQVGSDSVGLPFLNVVVRNGDHSGTLTAGTTGGGITVTSNPADGGSNCVVWNNKLRDFGILDEDLGDRDYNGINCGGKTNNLWFLDNSIVNVSGSAVQVGAGDTDCHHIYVGRNYSDNAAQAGMNNKFGKYVIFSQNTVKNVKAGSWTPTKGFGVQYNPHSTWFLYNTIINCGSGIRLAGANTSATPIEIYAIGNTLDNMYFDTEWQTWGATLMVGKGNYEFHAYNNLGFDTPKFLQMEGNNTQVHVRNNIIGFINPDRTPSQYEVNMFHSLEGAFDSNPDIQHNYISSDNVECRFGGEFPPDGTKTTTQAEFEAYIGNTTNTFNPSLLSGMTTIEQVVDAVKYNPIFEDIGLSIPASVYSNFLSAFGIPLDRGIDDKVVPQGVSVDVGPWEAGNSFIPVLPTPATNIKVNAGTESLEWALNSLNETSIKVFEDGVEIADLVGGVESYSLSGIATAEKTYSVTVANPTGPAKSREIVSDILMAVQLPDTLNQVLNPIKSYLAVRPYEHFNGGGLVIGEPQYSGGSYGIPSTTTTFSKNASPVGTGFNYVLNDTGSISGSIEGAGACEVIANVSSYDGTSTSRFQVNSTYVDVDALVGTSPKYKITVGVSGVKSYTLEPVTTNPKHSTGLISLVEV